MIFPLLPLKRHVATVHTAARQSGALFSPLPSSWSRTHAAIPADAQLGRLKIRANFSERGSASFIHADQASRERQGQTMQVADSTNPTGIGRSLPKCGGRSMRRSSSLRCCGGQGSQSSTLARLLSNDLIGSLAIICPAFMRGRT